MNEIIRSVVDLLGITEVYLVGGSLRDVLLNKKPKDYDFCTPLLPDEIESRVRKAGKRPYLIGKRFGTVGCKIMIDGIPELVEITTYRSESYVYGSRKPTVTFGSKLDEDLERRDFTVNALAMNSSERIVDPFGGQQDLKDGIIRCVKSPKQRFREDPLRTLRAIRFATTLGFAIEPDTLRYVEKMRYEILQISKERWVIELDKILSSENVRAGLYLLAHTKLLNILVPCLSLQVGYDQDSPYHKHNLFEHTVRVVEAVPRTNLDLRWAALLHDIGKPFTRSKNKRGYSNYLSHELLGADMSLAVSTHLKFSSERRDFIYETIKGHMNEDSQLREYDKNAK